MKRFIVKRAGFNAWIYDTLKQRNVESMGSLQERTQAAQMLNQKEESRKRGPGKKGR